MSIKDGILDLPLKKYWFNQIKSGEKTHEYKMQQSENQNLKETKRTIITQSVSALCSGAQMRLPL